MCEFINDGNNKCCGKIKYGNFCNKHRREHLIQNDFILLERFTYKSSDYLKSDILNTLNYIDKKKYNKSLKKDILFNIISEKYKKFNHYNNNRNSIVKIQLYYKKKYKNKYAELRGPGFIDKKLCNNQEDFFTYETINELNDKYFFSYKDDTNIIWFFDIRSFNKLIEMKQPNPYTMIPFSKNIINKSKNLTEHLKSKNITLNFKDELKELKKDKKNVLKQKIIDLSAILERIGMSFNIEWFTNLHTIQLKKLYGLMEDIWNYRAQLSLEMKRRICPPNGIIFNKSHHEIRNTNSKDTMRDFIISDVLKFNSATEEGDKFVGFSYFLAALAFVNPIVYDTHPWILNVL